MATQTMLTVEQFMAMPETCDGTHYELSEGELIPLPHPGFRHGALVMNVGIILGAALDRKRYIISGGDVGFVLDSASTSGTIRGADVAVNYRESVGEKLPVGYLALLAIEVVSPGNSAADLERKAGQYLAAGTREVWLLYPDTRRAYVYVNGTRAPKVFEKTERFTSVLGCEFEVDAFFDV